MVLFIGFQKVIEAHEWSTWVKHSLKLLQIVIRVIFGQLCLDVRFTSIDSYNEIDHDAMHYEVSRNDHDVAKLWCIFN